jgi:hypothetical protein
MTNLVRIAFFALALTIPAAASGSDDVVVAIKQKLTAARTSGGKLQVSGTYGTVGMIVFDMRDSRDFDSPARRKIISVAVSGFGDVVGYVLRKNGTSVCSFYGVTDGQCISVAGCVRGTVCD